jgi:putative transposase
MLILGERQLVQVLGEYELHYNTHRPHRALEQVPPIVDVGLDRTDGNRAVRRTEIIGGLINEYRHAA